MENPELSIFPEQEVVYGKFWPRFGAGLLDGLILWIPGKLLGLAIGGEQWLSIITSDKKYEYSDAQLHELAIRGIIYQLLTIVMYWLYFAIMESGEKQSTFGKRSLGLIVTNEAGGRISFAQATGRHFAKLLSAIILFIGYFMNLWDDRRQTLHDKMAHTLVVKKQL